MNIKLLLTVCFLCLSIKPYAQDIKGTNSVQCQLQKWTVNTYQNFKLIDSVLITQGACDDAYYYSVGNVYEQFQWKGKLLTVYSESNIVTLVSQTSVPTRFEDIKIKKRNHLPDSIVYHLDDLNSEDSISDYTSTVEGNYKYVKYTHNNERISIGVNLVTGEVEEFTVTRNVRKSDGKVDIERRVTKLVDHETNVLTIRNIVDPERILLLEETKLTEQFTKLGYSLFEL